MSSLPDRSRTSIAPAIAPADSQWEPLTPTQRQAFEQDGYLLLRGVLDQATVESLLGATDALCAAHLEGRREEFVLDDFVSADDRFVDLVDHPRVLPKIAGILGANIALYHSQLIVKPPSGKPPRVTTFSYHQDSGRVNLDLESVPRPRLSLKVAYYLTDVSVEGRGNTWVVRGSHLGNDLVLPESGLGQPDGAEPVYAQPGDALIFDRRVWHAGTRNWSELTRKTLFYGYGYRWLQPKDELRIRGRLNEIESPIRRQLLGEATPNGRYSAPVDQIPLQALLDAIGSSGRGQEV